MGRSSSSSVRKALRARRVRRAPWRVPIVDAPVLEDAVTALNEARAALTVARVGDVAPGVAEALQQQHDDAKAAVDACFSTVWFQGLQAKELEALQAEHPPAEDGKDDPDGPLVDMDTFLPALCAACALDSDLTEAEWAEEIAGMTAGEKDELQIIVTFANTKSWSQVIPKG